MNIEIKAKMKSDFFIYSVLLDDEEIKNDYIARTQHPKYDQDPNYINTSTREDRHGVTDKRQ